jgi:predicted nucleic acid-binding Zn ribbon protein
MKRRTTNEQPLKAVIDDWLSEHPMANKAKETRVAHFWGALLGPAVKNRTKSIYFKNGRLSVKLDSSVLRNELSFARESIIENINKELGETVVTELVLN